MKPQTPPHAPAAADPAPATHEVVEDFTFSPIGQDSLDGILSQAQGAKEALKPAAPPAGDASLPPTEDGPVDFTSFVPTESDGTQATPPPAPEAGPKKGDKAGNAMREQLKKINEEKEQIAQQLTQLKTEKEQVDALIAETKKRLEDEAKQRSELQGRLTQRDPRQSPAVQSLTSEWNRDLANLAVVMSEHDIDSTGLNEFMTKAVQEYAMAGDPSSPEFREKASKVRQRVSSVFGSELAEKGMDLVRSGVVTMRKVQGVIQDMQKNMPKYEYEEGISLYKKEVDSYTQEENSAFNPPEELRENDPLNPKVILGAMVSGSDEIKASADKVKKFTKFALLPLPPVDPALLEGKTPEQRNQFLGDRMNKHRQAFKSARALFPEALLALQILPSLWERMTNLENQLKNKCGAVPKPKLNGGAPPVEPAAVGAPDITKFEPVNPLAQDL